MNGQTELGRRRVLAALFCGALPGAPGGVRAAGPAAANGAESRARGAPEASIAVASDAPALTAPEPPALAALAAAAHARVDAPDGRWVALAHGEALTLFDRTGRDTVTLPGTDRAGRLRARCTQLLALAGRRSIVAVWPGLGELWALSLDPAAPPIFDGLVHDYRMGEAIATRGYLNPRRTVLGEPGAPVPRFHAVAPGVAWLAGVRDDQVQVWHLDVRRRIAGWVLPGARPAGSWLAPSATGGPPDWWLPVGEGLVVIDTGRWQVRERRPG